NSNFQWSTTSRDVKDGNAQHITREPEQVKAFRDTWRDGIHSYLTYLRDRLTVARDLLTESGSIFVQIGDENVHRVRAVMDEVFGDVNCVSLVTLKKSSGLGGNLLPNVCDYIVWYAKDRERVKFRPLFETKGTSDDSVGRYNSVELSDGTRRPMTKEERDGQVQLPENAEPYSTSDPTAQGYRPNTTVPYRFRGETYHPGKTRCWRSVTAGLDRLDYASRLFQAGNGIAFLRKLSDYPVFGMNNIWMDVGGVMSRSDPKVYVVQTSSSAIARCIQMATDPGDLVLDPTCGSGTTAYAAEQWGRRWVTIDTSRVALALARARIMGARYPYYLLADSPEGQHKEAEVTRNAPSTQPTHGNIRHGFVYERVPHITLKSIANNAEIDV
ncbi:MAG: site-specific DNA-methyltransferase, partial [Caldilineaceae bacterium]|nr:site-specific DNA-methyltransferase [Caldilineaceae bacterium]